MSVAIIVVVVLFVAFVLGGLALAKALRSRNKASVDALSAGAYAGGGAAVATVQPETSCTGDCVAISLLPVACPAHTAACDAICCYCPWCKSIWCALV